MIKQLNYIPASGNRVVTPKLEPEAAEREWFDHWLQALIADNPEANFFFTRVTTDLDDGWDPSEKDFDFNRVAMPPADPEMPAFSVNENHGSFFIEPSKITEDKIDAAQVDKDEHAG